MSRRVTLLVMFTLGLLAGTSALAQSTRPGDGLTLAGPANFFASHPAFTGGVRVAAGDVNQGGVPDIITGAGPGGGPHVQVFSGLTGALLRSSFAYAPTFTGGVFVAGHQ